MARTMATWPRMFCCNAAAVMALLVLLSASQSQVDAQQPGGISVGYYQSNGLCNSDVEGIVLNTVQTAAQNDPTVPAALLRLMFHDCWVQGCDGSILIDPTASNQNPEKLAEPNLTVRGYNVIDQAKVALEAVCPKTVSCADVVALAAWNAVSLSGLSTIGSPMDMPTGRLDGRVSSGTEAAGVLVSSQSTAAELTAQFEQQGFSQDEMITLSGAHTIGRAHCSEISSRLYNFPGSANGVDPSLDPTYAASLQAQCPRDPEPSTTVELDPITPFIVDNNYYTNGMDSRALLPSDNAIFQDFQTEFSSILNSDSNDLWQQKFADALLHMSSLNLKSGKDGEIRVNCRAVNNIK